MPWRMGLTDAPTIESFPLPTSLPPSPLLPLPSLYLSTSVSPLVDPGNDLFPDSRWKCPDPIKGAAERFSEQGFPSKNRNRRYETGPNLGPSVSPSVGPQNSVPPGPSDTFLSSSSSSSSPLSSLPFSPSTEQSTHSLPSSQPSPSTLPTPLVISPPPLPGLSSAGLSFKATAPRDDSEEQLGFEEAGQSVKVILDSGSNITLMSEAMANQLLELGRLLVIERRSPTNDLGRVRFGKRNAQSNITMVVQGAGLLDKVVVVEEVDVCLISVGWFTRARDMEVKFTKEAVDLSYEGVVVSQGIYDEGLGMYVFDMLELLSAPDPRLPSSPRHMEAFAARRVQRFKQAVVVKALTLHKNLGCIPFESMALCLEVREDGSRAWDGVDPEITPALCRELARKKSCITCALARWRQEKLEGSGVKQSYATADIGKYIVTDLCGKFTPPSHNRSYFQYVGCPLTKYHKVYGQSSPMEALGSIRQWIIHCLQHGHVPQYLWNDNGSVEASDLAAECYAQWGIKGISTPSKIPLYSVEREIQLKLDDIEALLLVTPFWTAANWLDAAIKSAQNRSYVLNSSSVLLSPTKTPFELFTHRPPPMECFARYGTGDIVVAQTATEERKIGQSRNQLGLVLEIKDDGSKASELRMPGKLRVIDRGNLQKVHLDPPPTPRLVSVLQSADKSDVVVTTTQDVDCSSSQALLEYQSRLEGLKLREEEKAVEAARPLLERVEKEATIRDIIQERSGWDSQDERNDAEIYLPQPQRDYWEGELTEFLAANRSGTEDQEESCAFWAEMADTSYTHLNKEVVREIHTYRAAFGHFPDYSSSLSPSDPPSPSPTPPSSPRASRKKDFMAFAVSLARNFDESPSLGRVERSLELQKLWSPAMQKEIKGWMTHAHQIPKQEALDKGVTPHVTTFTTKRGTGIRKARVTFHGGYELRTNPEFRDHRYRLFAPAMDTDLFLFLLAFATYFRMRRFSSDVTQCFGENDMANATFKRDLVVRLSEWECGVKGGAYYQIDCVIYGCPDASMEWHKRLREFLRGTIGMTVSIFNPCLFILRLSTISLILCGTATDNLEFFFTDNRPTEVKLEWIVAKLNAKWPMTHQEEAKDVLGFAIAKRPDGVVHVTQPSTVTAVERFFFPDGLAPKTIVPELPTYRKPMESSLRPTDLKPYQCGLGIMVYLRGTRKDLMVSFSQLAEHAQKPRIIDSEALRYAAAYVVTTRDVGLSFFPGPPTADISRPFPFHGHADAAWNTGDVEGASRLGRMITPGTFPDAAQLEDRRVSAPFFAKSGKEQGVNSTSVCQAELKSAVQEVTDIMVFRGMSEEMAGIADEGTLADVPKGAAPPTQLRAAPTKEAMTGALGNPPTTLGQDNLSLVIVAGQDVSKKPKMLRHMSRSLGCLRTAVREGIIEVVSVPAAEQRANPLTKNHSSPTMHWKEVEFVQGSQPEVLRFQQEAAHYGRLKKSPRQLGEMVKTSGTVEEERMLEDWSDVMDVGVTVRNTEANAQHTAQTQEASYFPH